MKLKEMLAGLFCKKKVCQGSNDTTDKPIEERQLNADPYGLNGLNVLLMIASGDYGWEYRTFKKVTLTNVEDCKGRLNVTAVQLALNGTGHAEWETLLAVNFVKDVSKALENNSSEADISNIFSCDLLASRGRVFSQKEIYDHLIRFFKIIGETDDELRLAVNVG